MKTLSCWHSVAFHFSLLFFAGGLTIASAHEVWIEDTPEGQLFVRFAEYGDHYEKSPGHLDSLSISEAFTVETEGKPEAFVVQKKSEGYLLVNASPKSQAFVEAPFAVMGGGENQDANRSFMRAGTWAMGPPSRLLPSISFRPGRRERRVSFSVDNLSPTRK